ncbi:hypothetical protein [Acidithiobacillus sp.]|uniref:hypothetical protein n=1 Tax=Acidithiobacillus sp. TaxID=1872118 RepID=UPI0025C60E2A|nr:hypothetical protein [Acidithiobacillus sp.]MCK9188452.1 hypothetical protein [Acidithiobacillus sp.]MCK9358873.1 hypothetical protein [Acidithiobacillus sp.]
MAKQSLEPDYYTLEELADRWEKSEDILQRLALEGKVECFFSLTEEEENMDAGWDEARGDVREYFSKKSFRFRASEIHRMERQHEAVEKAAADDVLGTRERETMQAVIAAMTQVIASTAPKYKCGDRPNVDAIASTLEGIIPDRKKRGISETISKALKAGLIRT